jgi:hypothetical protein
MVSTASLHNLLNVEGGLTSDQLLACCMLREYLRSGEGNHYSAAVMTCAAAQLLT